MISDGPHALSHRLVLYGDVTDAGVLRTVALGVAVNAPVVVHPVAAAPTAIPISGVGFVNKLFEQRFAIFACRYVGGVAFVHAPRYVKKHAVLVVHGHPSACNGPRGKAGVWCLRPEREHEMRDSPRHLPIIVGSITPVHGTPVGGPYLVLWGSIGDGRTHGVIGRQVVGREHAHVQEADMRGINISLKRLQPVALALQTPDFVVGDQVGLNVGQGGGEACSLPM